METLCVQSLAQRTRAAALKAGLSLLFAVAALPAQAQVAIEDDGGGITISTAGFGAQHLTRAMGKTDGDVWVVTDASGYQYPVISYARSTENGSEKVVIITSPGDYQGVESGEEDAESQGDTSGDYQGGETSGDDEDKENSDGDYQGKEGGDGEDAATTHSGDYQDALRRLRRHHGAQVRHDKLLGADLISFPDVEDPIQTFFDAVRNDSLHGQPLLDFFGLVEVVTLGAFGEPGFSDVDMDATQSFPNDPLYPYQWNLRQTGLDRALWHPARARRAARVSIIDSGVGRSQRSHGGLDGTDVVHKNFAPTKGTPVPHALGILTLLADRGDEGAGIVGLLGTWEGNGCYAHDAFLAAKEPRLLSYNVGDFGPSTFQIARAIRTSVERGADVINLSLRTAPSPSIAAAIQHALKKGVSVVAAAGNYAPSAPSKPAAFPARLGGVLAVGASRADGMLSARSASDGLDLLAPGEDVLVGGVDDTWHFATGTSYAAPHVTAAIALLRSANPDLTPEEIRQVLVTTAGPGGQLDAFAALNAVLPADQRVDMEAFPAPGACLGNAAPAFAATTNPVVSAGTTTQVAVSASDADGDAVALVAADLPSFASFTDHGDGTGTLTLAPAAHAAGKYRVMLQASDGASLSEHSVIVTVTAGAVVARINAGGDAVQLPDGTAWQADAHYTTTSSAYLSDQAVAHTDADALYQTARQGDGFTYRIPVPESGRYTVRLHFAETYWGVMNGPAGGAGKRVTQAWAENETVLDGLDVAAVAGPLAAHVETFEAMVTDGVLNLTFVGVKHKALVAGIEVLGSDASGAAKAEMPHASVALTLDQNAPNPFQTSTRIAFTLPEEATVTLAVYDVLGRQVAVLADGAYPSGTHEVSWNAPSLSSGMYLYRLVAGRQVATRSMVLAR